MKIKILPAEVASQIAAGEVVERPASVVKELLENALDAGASFINISIEGAGRRLIEVADDGCGITADELSLAVSRHATSKLTSAADLFYITTLGFRGEALASIASVARLTLTSRPPEADIGARLHVEAGQASPVQPVGAPSGSVTRVEDLFYNVPARLKFLKSDVTERRQIDELVTRYALAYPRVRFHLRQDGRPSLQTSGNGDRREILASLYGVDNARNMLEVIAEYHGNSAALDVAQTSGSGPMMRITGFVSPVSITRSNRREITFFVNGRWVQDSALTAALIQAYHTFLMVGRYPMALLFLDLPPDMVDVNVHPAKSEVRFRDKDRVFSAVQRAVRRALKAYTPVPGLFGDLPLTPPDNALAAGGHPAPWESSSQEGSESLSLGPGSWEQRETYPAETPPISHQPPIANLKSPILRLVGQVASAYLVAEGPDGLYLIDQHAAHERVLFERFMAQRTSTIPAQTLLEPAAVEFPPASARLLVEQLPALSRLGFQVEIFGANTFLVRAIPVLLAGSDPAAALRVLVEDFEEDETPLQGEMEARIIARVCKRAAVKAGRTLSTEEQRALLQDLEACHSPRTCPHGRPTMIHLSVDLLARQFGRKGAR